MSRSSMTTVSTVSARTARVSAVLRALRALGAKPEHTENGIPCATAQGLWSPEGLDALAARLQPLAEREGCFLSVYGGHYPGKVRKHLAPFAVIEVSA